MHRSPRTARTRLRLFALLPCLISCVGSIGGDPSADHEQETDDDEAALCARPEPFLRRLTTREYRATLDDLVGPGVAVPLELPADSFLDGFDNQAPTLGVSALHIESYLKSAGAIAGAVRDDAATRDAVFGCGELPVPDDACLTSFVERFGRRAYRRPLEQDDVDALFTLAATAADDDDGWRGATLMLEAMLQSPHFLYRVEIGVEDAGDAGVHRLTGYEIASRLSFLIWQTGPNDWLLDRAGAGDLDDADGIEATALVMLDDPRARAGLAAFTQQWVRLPLLAQVSRSADLYPAWSEALRASMLEETRRLLDDYTWDDGVPLLGVLGAPYTYVDDELAALYGIQKLEPGWERVDLGGVTTRRGLLTHASFLTLGPSSETTAPILRGKLVRDVFLCTPVPPPPPDIPDVPEAEPGESLREQLARHREDGACVGCHEKMDPIGFGFEQYDLIGGFRETDASGSPLTGQGEIVDIEGGAFRGPSELGDLLSGAAEVETCTMKHLFRFAAGRTEAKGDTCVVDELSEAFSSSGGTLRGALIALVRSEGFVRVGGDQ